MIHYRTTCILLLLFLYLFTFNTFVHHGNRQVKGVLQYLSISETHFVHSDSLSPAKHASTQPTSTRPGHSCIVEQSYLAPPASRASNESLSFPIVYGHISIIDPHQQPHLPLRSQGLQQNSVPNVPPLSETTRNRPPLHYDNLVRSLRSETAPRSEYTYQ